MANSPFDAKFAEYFCVISDDGHLYLVPATHRAEGVRYLEEIVKYWDEGEMEHDPRAMPEWMEEIDSLDRLIFKDPKADYTKEDAEMQDVGCGSINAR